MLNECVRVQRMCVCNECMSVTCAACVRGVCNECV